MPVKFPAMQMLRRITRRAANFFRHIGISWRRTPPGDKLAALVGSAVGLIGVFVGIIGLIVTFMGVWLARQQTDIARDQGRIAARQAEIAEAQHKFFKEQLSRVANLELKLYQTPELKNESSVFRVGVKNNGTGSARDFYWRLYIPVAWRDWIEVQPADLPLMKARVELYDGHDNYILHGGYASAPTYPGRVTTCAWLIVSQDLLKQEFDAVSDNRLRWYIVAEAGRFPPEGFGVLDFNNPNAPGPAEMDVWERQ
jgi:hypothetical protein